ncbi:type II/IV secretion system protein [Candidatus Saccharibacteria bacterium]|nr:type II/IV secretion system protein [Candidatus Saccharibacteria bacterium]
MDEQEVQRKRRANEERGTAERARVLGFPYLDTRRFENDIPLVKGVLTVEEMKERQIIPLQKGSEESHYQFLVTSATPKSAVDKMREQYLNGGERADFFLISESAYKAFMLRYDPPKEAHFDDIEIADEGDSKTFGSVSQTLEEVPSDKVFDYLINQADKLGASDIHIENQRDDIRIRMRVDGILHPVASVSRERYRVIMGELSSRANVSTAATTPQSGHMQTDIYDDNGSHLLNIRVETVPTLYGQDAVLRLFNFDESLMNLDLLGLEKDERAEINNVISHPHGLVLMVGPTGSGKSTTLYSILNALNSTERKIITLEDPIEYGIAGISQISIDTTHGENFADSLRSVLRLDPDVVMVGEIRDADTARTAIQASITGHLVLSSFHASSAPAAFSRMIDMIGTNPIFSSSIRLVIAQRLVRKLSSSKKSYQPDKATLEYIHKVLDSVPAEKLKTYGVDLDNITLYEPVPTEGDPFGYRGRTVIMEQLIVNDEIQAFIRGDIKDVNTDAIAEVAIKNGMLTLEQKGVILALKGETSLEEVSRVI